MKKYKVLLLCVCILAIVAVIARASWERIQTEQTQKEYIALLEDARAHFADFRENHETSSFDQGVRSFTEATKMLYADGEQWDNYVESSTMMSVASIMEGAPWLIETNLDNLLLAFDDILEYPLYGVGYHELLNFLNRCNHTE